MAMNNRHKATAVTRKTHKRDPHFYELLDLAAEGNEEAIHDLWLTYGYNFAKEGRGND